MIWDAISFLVLRIEYKQHKYVIVSLASTCIKDKNHQKIFHQYSKNGIRSIQKVSMIVSAAICELLHSEHGELIPSELLAEAKTAAS